tara:strand:- start:97 stop:315 length:219 start_codon:yes stop_codon:yes gene_type:complete
MSTKAIKTKLQKKIKDAEKANAEIKKLRDELKMNIATIADNCGLLDLEISDAELKKEFQEIFSKYYKKQKAA